MKKTNSEKPCHRCFGRGVEPDQKAIGAMLRKNRKIAGISLTVVASRMKLSVAYICRLESGQKAWSTGLIQRFNKAINNKKKNQ